VKPQSYRFRFRTGEIVIDHTKCAKCKTYACVKADSLFGTGVLRIQGRKPILTTSFDDAARLCNECLACELYCQTHGKKALKIRLDTLSD
jgi:ferredoxin